MYTTQADTKDPTQFLVDGFMLAVLDAVKKELPQLLRDEDDWNGMHIDYEVPHVDRLWRPWGEYRVHLHHIHPCGGAAPFWHPHRTPSAMEVVEGTYRMRQGRGPGTEPPRISSQVLLVPGCQYEMIDVDAWHSVQPECGPVLSIMVTAPPWQPLREMPKLPQARQKPLPAEARSRLLHFFRRRFPSFGMK